MLYRVSHALPQVGSFQKFQGQAFSKSRFGAEGLQVWLPNYYFPYDTPSHEKVQNPGMLNEMARCIAKTNTSHAMVLPATPELLKGAKKIDTVRVKGLQPHTIEVDVYHKQASGLERTPTQLYVLHHPQFLYQTHYTKGMVPEHPFVKTYGKPPIARQAQHVLFDRAYKQFLHKQLTQQKETDTVQPTVLMDHAWHTLPASHELAKVHPQVKLVPFQHDTFITEGITPDALDLKPLALDASVLTPEGHLSASWLTHHGVDGLLLNPAHGEYLKQEYAHRGQETLKSSLAHLQAQGKFYPIHHALPVVKLPYATPHLTGNFQALSTDKPSWKAFEVFKRHNKQALLTTYFQEHAQGATLPPVLSYTARLGWEKNALASMVTIQALLEKHPDLKVLVCGSMDAGDTNPHWQALMATLTKHYPQRFKFLGHLTAPEVTKLQAGSDFNLHPSACEPFGLSTLEALAMGNILVTLPSSANKQLVERLTSRCIAPQARTFTQFLALKQEGKTFGKTGVIGSETRELAQALEAGVSHYITHEYQTPQHHAENQLAGLHYVQKYHSQEAIAGMFEQAFQRMKQPK
ncbi:MAG: glycosyltransferase [Vampirovibrionales bacterium]